MILSLGAFVVLGFASQSHRFIVCFVSASLLLYDTICDLSFCLSFDLPFLFVSVFHPEP